MKARIVGAFVALLCLITGSRAQARWHLFGQDDGGLHILHHSTSSGDQDNLGASATPAPSTMAQPNLQAAMAAAADPENQAIAAKVFCYCGCDQKDGHHSLLDCYRTGHIPVCKTCQNEFIRIGQLRAQGETLATIQNTIDGEFSHVYPFTQPSQALRNYLSTKQSPGVM